MSPPEPHCSPREDNEDPQRLKAAKKLASMQATRYSSGSSLFLLGRSVLVRALG
ncbi:hypothetical protein GCM10010360_62460 [Streptomyces nogalater]